MVDLSLRANIAHPLADSDKERLSSKQTLLQAPEETLKNWRFSIKFSFFLFSYSLSMKKNAFLTLIMHCEILKVQIAKYVLHYCSLSLDTVDENGIFFFWLHWAME